ncbi:delta endotoxin C-terminal domain-containing protein [Bacillus cereus]|nr:delta endotoxin C-terminal domain-containing protein [Bacillus cereus]MEB9568965.1 delta endotoxin C-terminal domain-containing protein [Bacillus cereus]
MSGTTSNDLRNINFENADVYKITQIPAVKTFDLPAGTGYAGFVTAGPGYTGGDVVFLPYQASLKICLTPTLTNKNYRVRLRYASAGAGTFRVERWLFQMLSLLVQLRVTFVHLIMWTP